MKLEIQFLSKPSTEIVMIKSVFLNSLPAIHPLRNKPLCSICAEVRPREGSWSLIKKSWKTGNNTYNELPRGWREMNDFKAPLK